MNQAIGLSSAAFGVGSGVFFLGYFLFEVPSNLILERVGARLWIARVMITWGAVSAATALVRGPTGFYVLRFVLGAAEAGFFPGIILYLSYWFPARHRASVTALFMAAAPVSTALGSPVSAALLKLDGALGLAGCPAAWGSRRRPMSIPSGYSHRCSSRSTARRSTSPARASPTRSRRSEPRR